jgi:hypothetical protein
MVPKTKPKVIFARSRNFSPNSASTLVQNSRADQQCGQDVFKTWRKAWLSEFSTSFRTAENFASGVDKFCVARVVMLTVKREPAASIKGI